MFLKYDKKDKRKFILLNAIVLLGVIGMGYTAMTLAKVEFPSVEEKFKVGLGFVMIIAVVIMAMSNVISILFKFKSLGFVVAALILFLLKNVVDLLFLTTFLVSIPLLFNDLVVRNYFKYLNMTKYFEIYKHLVKRNE